MALLESRRDPPPTQTAPALQESIPPESAANRTIPARGFSKSESRETVSVCVLLDGNAVVHLVDPQDLRLATIAAELVILAHDERFNRLGRANLRTEAAKTAARQVEVEIVENLDFLPR